MPNHPALIPAVCLTIAAAGLLSVAGPLDPPPGEPQPTMHTLDEIYEAIAGQHSRWESLVLKNHKGEKHVLAGSGTVHAMVCASFNTAGIVELRQGDGTPIAVGTAHNGADTVPLDVRYSNGLVLATLDGWLDAVTILYLPDAP